MSVDNYFSSEDRKKYINWLNKRSTKKKICKKKTLVDGKIVEKVVMCGNYQMFVKFVKENGDELTKKQLSNAWKKIKEEYPDKLIKKTVTKKTTSKKVEDEPMKNLSKDLLAARKGINSAIKNLNELKKKNPS